MAGEGVELGEAVACGAVAVEDPDVGVWVAKLGTERKASPYTQRPKSARVKPREGARRRDDVRGRPDEVATVSHQDGVSR